MIEFMKEIKRFREEGISDQELAFLKSAVGQSDARKYETPGQKAALLNNIVRYNLDKDFVQKQNEILKTITKEEINALAKKHLPVEKMNIMLVGDNALIKPGLQKLGYEIVELDTDGNLAKPAETLPTPAPAASDTKKKEPSKPRKGKTEIRTS